MSNLIPSLPEIQAPLPSIGETAGNATPGDVALATIILGSTTEPQPSSLLARDIELILSPTIISIVLSHFNPHEFDQIVPYLAQPNQQDKVIQDACIEQMQSHNPPNTPMRYLDVLPLAQMTPGPLPHIFQLDFSNTGPNTILSYSQRCPNLQALNLGNTLLLNNHLLSLGTPLLQSLDISGCKKVSIEGLQNLTNLRCLNLLNCNADDLNKLPPLLEHLTLSLQPHTKGELRHLTKLKSLNLLGYPKVHPNIIRNTLIQIPSLQYIHLGNCAPLSSDSLRSLANEFSMPRFIYYHPILCSNRPTPNIGPSGMTKEELRAIYPSLVCQTTMPTLAELDVVYS